MGPSDFPKVESTLINIILNQPLYICFDVDVLHWIFVLHPQFVLAILDFACIILQVKSHNQIV